jgi:N-acetylneuraminic acid mutarotase
MSSTCIVETLEARRLFAATTLRIDVGGDGHTEASGKVWQADRGFTAGQTASGGYAVAGTGEDALFTSRRFGDFSYSLPIRNGTYKVKLLLCEPTHTAAGQRMFNVAAEKKWLLRNFDIAAAGGGKASVVKSFTTTVSDGRLNLWFDSVKDNAIVSAIEVLPTTPPTPTIAWRELAAAPMPQFESQGEVIGDKLYIFGGFVTDTIETTSKAYAFDAARGKWSRIADVPLSQTHAGSASDGAFVYLAGGFVGNWKGINTPVSRKVFRYDTVTNEWTAMLPLPAPRGAGALVRVGRKLHFFGGLDGRYRDRGEHWVLDLRKPNKWVNAAPLPNPRNHLGSALMGTKIYAIGGQHRLDEEHGNVADVHVLDVITGTWSAVASLPQPRSHTHNSTFVIGGDRLVIAGGSANDHVTLTDVLQYTEASNKWSVIGAIPEPRSAAVVKLLGDHIIATGGTTATIDPKTDTWISR